MDSYIVLFYSAGALKALYTRCHIDPFTVFYAFQCLLTIILGYLACRLGSQGTNHQPSTQQMTCPTSWTTATPRKSVINCAVGTPPQRELMRWWWDVVMRTLEPRITSWLQPMGKTKKPRTPGCCVRNIHESLHQCPELKWRSSISQPVQPGLTDIAGTPREKDPWYRRSRRTANRHEIQVGHQPTLRPLLMVLQLKVDWWNEGPNASLSSYVRFLLYFFLFIKDMPFRDCNVGGFLRPVTSFGLHSSSFLNF